MALLAAALVISPEITREMSNYMQVAPVIRLAIH